MATSTVKFYKVSFPSEVNTRVDELANYLGSLEEYTVSNFQYVRHGINIELKFNLSQEEVDKFNYNYCGIKNTDENIKIFYYIKDVTQVSNNTLKISLRMDTVNSLTNPREFTSETEITRKHKDRFLKPTNWNPSVGGFVARSIDKNSEGIVPDKLKVVDNVITDLSADCNWYLIYKNQNIPDPQHPEANNPVETYICADVPIKVGVQSTGSSKTYNPSDLEEGKYYYFLDVDNAQGTFDINSVETVLGSTRTKCLTTTTIHNIPAVYTTVSTVCRGLVLKRNGNNIDYTCIYDKIHLVWNGNFNTPDVLPAMYSNIRNVSTGQGITSLGEIWTSVSSVVFTQANYFRTSTTDYVSMNFQPEAIVESTDAKEGIYVGTHTSQILSTISDIDRTDSKLIKIIKCPYSPVQYTKDVETGIYDFGENWIYSLGLLKYKLNNLPELGVTINSMFYLTPLKYLISTDMNTMTHEKIRENESKLYHSDFCSNKLVYDSFVKEIKLENVAPNINNSSVSVGVGFKPTSTINSKFGFNIFFPSATGSLNEDEDFDKYLLTTRNNEEVILNNEYVNYIKNGYNYDKKANALQLEQAQRQATTSTIASVGSIIAGLVDVAVGTKVMGAGMIAGGISGIVGSGAQWSNVQKTQEQQQNAMQAKLAQLAAQSSSTSGTDDVDLMSWYSGNRLHFMQYKPWGSVVERVWKMLDYTGYACIEYNTPEVDSRIWYNFIQCTPHIAYEGTKELKDEWIKDLKSKYQEGVTVFHKNIINGVSTWDFDRQYENWETWVIGE